MLITEKIKLNFKIINLKCQFDQPLTSNAYNYTIKLVSPNLSLTGEHSTNILN